MDSVNILGLAAAVMTTASFFPQVIKTWKTKSAGDFSIWMLVLLSSGIFVWTIYGFLIGSLPIILANSVSFVLTVIIAAFKIRYK